MWVGWSCHIAARAFGRYRVGLSGAGRFQHQSAARTRHDLGVVTVVPGGSIVEVTGCSGEWCTANWHGRVGYMIATHLDLAAGPVAPRVVAVYPEPYYGPYVYGGPYFYGPRIFIGPRYRHFRRW